MREIIHAAALCVHLEGLVPLLTTLRRFLSGAFRALWTAPPGRLRARIYVAGSSGRLHCLDAAWALHTGAELDLLVVRGRLRLGFEVKFTNAPRVTPSMRSALSALSLDRLEVLHAGKGHFPSGREDPPVAVSRILEDVERL